MIYIVVICNYFICQLIKFHNLFSLKPYGKRRHIQIVKLIDHIYNIISYKHLIFKEKSHESEKILYCLLFYYITYNLLLFHIFLATVS